MEGELATIDFGNGIVLPCVIFVCPVCPDQHGHVVAYGIQAERIKVSDHLAPGREREIPVWKHEGGTTIDDITLAPSYYVPSCKFHGFVRNGYWEDC